MTSGPETTPDRLSRRLAGARVRLIRARAARDRAAVALTAIRAAAEDAEPDTPMRHELRRALDDAERELADTDQEIQRYSRLLDALERGLPLTIIASYHAGRIAAHREQGRTTTPALDGRPGTIPDWMWKRWETLTPTARAAAVQQQHEAFTRRN